MIYRFYVYMIGIMGKICVLSLSKQKFIYQLFLHQELNLIEIIGSSERVLLRQICRRFEQTVGFRAASAVNYQGFYTQYRYD